MKLCDRIRKIIKWSALAMTAALMVCWIGSNWYSADVCGEDEHWALNCYGGMWKVFVFRDGSPGIKREIAIRRERFEFRWWRFSWRRTRVGDGYSLVAPAWIPVLLVGSVACVAWGPDIAAVRRRRTNRCFKCGYHRAGLKPDAPCPECGARAMKMAA